MPITSLNPAWGANTPYSDQGYPPELRNQDLWSAPPGSGVTGLPGATPGGPSLGYPALGQPAPGLSVNTNPLMAWLRQLAGPAPNEQGASPGLWHAGGSPSGPIIPAPGGAQAAQGPAPSPLGSSGAVDAQTQPTRNLNAPGALYGPNLPPSGDPWRTPIGGGAGNTMEAPTGTPSETPRPGRITSGSTGPSGPSRRSTPNLGHYPAPPPANSPFTQVNMLGHSGPISALDLSKLFKRQ
jgi:hypothetical protein